MNVDPLIQIAGPDSRPHPDLSWQDRLDRLRAEIATLGSVVVAYSGGVDSSLVLRVAHEVLGERCLGAIGRSDSYAASELALALEQAASFGARVEIVTTGELSDPAFRSNPVNRCYHCKSELYRELDALAVRHGAAAILDGTIADDSSDWRPGMQAASERGIRSPLADLGFRKQDVRAAAAHLGLASQDKPASPCLASRIPYGTEITHEILGQVEAGEKLIRGLGFRELRLRHHGEVARIEIPSAELGRALAPAVRDALVTGLKSLGYSYITLDLEGFRSGSLNGTLVALLGGSETSLTPANPSEPSPPESTDMSFTKPGTGASTPGI